MAEIRLSTEADRQNVLDYHPQFNTKDILEIIARALVDEPEFVSINEVGGSHTSILELKVGKADVGKIIGKQGRTAGALRILLSALSAKLRKRILLEIVDQ